MPMFSLLHVFYGLFSDNCKQFVFCDLRESFLCVLHRNRQLVDAAIEHVLKQQRSDTAQVVGGLTLTDVFYREVVMQFG